MAETYLPTGFSYVHAGWEKRYICQVILFLYTRCIGDLPLSILLYCFGEPKDLVQVTQCRLATVQLTQSYWNVISLHF